jgi:hypothetical protein
MSWSDDARDAMLTGLTGLIDRIGLADPSGTELTGGDYDGPFTPSWAAPSGGVVSATPAAVQVPAATVEWVLFMEDGTPDVVHALFPYMAGVTAPIIVPVDITNSGDLLTAQSHGFVDDDRVALYPVLDESLPSGLSGPPELYYVVSATTDTFQVSETSGGGAVAISADGRAWAHQGLPEVFAAAGQSTVTATLDARVV